MPFAPEEGTLLRDSLRTMNSVADALVVCEGGIGEQSQHRACVRPDLLPADGDLVPLSGPLPGFRSHDSRCRAGDRTTRRQGSNANRRAMLDGTNYRQIIRAMGIRHGSKALFAAHPVNHALLPPREHSVRKNRKIAEHPEHIYTLQEGRS